MPKNCSRSISVSRTAFALLTEQAMAEGTTIGKMIERVLDAIAPRPIVIRQSWLTSPMQPSRERQVLGDHLCDAWGIQ